MFYVLVYFLFSYLLVAALYSGAKRILRALPGDRFGARRRESLRHGLLAVLLFLPVAPYALVAAQTALFLPSLRSAVLQAASDTGMMDDDVVPNRIFWLTPTDCYVAVREPFGETPPISQTENVIHLRRSSSDWRLHDWYTAWSEVGSADGNTFPPVWDAKEF